MNQSKYIISLLQIILQNLSGLLDSDSKVGIEISKIEVTDSEKLVKKASKQGSSRKLKTGVFIFQPFV